MSAVVDERTASAPEVPAVKEHRPRHYTKSGRPTQKFLRELVDALPKERKRLGLNRALKRALIRDAQRKEVREFMPKVLPVPAWRNVPYAFKRFNPDAVIGGSAINVREAA